MKVKNLSYIKINSANTLYLTINKINGHIEESNGGIYLTLVPTDESKVVLENYEDLRSRMRDLIRSKTNNSDNYDKKYMKMKFISTNNIHLKKTLELHSIIIGVRSGLHEDNKYYLYFV